MIFQKKVYERQKKNVEKKIFRPNFFFFNFLEKNRVRQNFNAVFGLEKTALDRIPRYRRTALQKECLYLVLHLPWVGMIILCQSLKQLEFGFTLNSIIIYTFFLFSHILCVLISSRAVTFTRPSEYFFSAVQSKIDYQWTYIQSAYIVLLKKMLANFIMCRLCDIQVHTLFYFLTFQ